jgi:hypothetical protein
VDGADLHELLSVSGWYRKPSVIPGWLGMHHHAVSRTFTKISISNVLKTRLGPSRIKVSYLCMRFSGRASVMLSARHFFRPAFLPAKLTKAIARVGRH